MQTAKLVLVLELDANDNVLGQVYSLVYRYCRCYCYYYATPRITISICSYNFTPLYCSAPTNYYRFRGKNTEFEI